MRHQGPASGVRKTNGHRKCSMNHGPKPLAQKHTHPILSSQLPQRAQNGKVVRAEEAVRVIRDGDTIATAARNSAGFVIVQVERIAERGTLNAGQVKIPGIMVDCAVISQPKNHWQTFADVYNPSFSSEIRVPTQSVAPMAMSDRFYDGGGLDTAFPGPAQADRNGNLNVSKFGP
jgi:acyl CoA:acetate/3-ketoacid CoA transferase